MGLRFRKSVNIGPVQANLSNSGIGWSINLGIVRVGLNAQRKMYLSVGIPGTGLYYTTQINQQIK